MIKLFDIEGGKVIPSPHCYSFDFLKVLMDKYAKDKEYLKVYQYLFYMTCPNPDMNPTFHMTAEEKEPFILKELKMSCSLDEVEIVDALTKCGKLYETETLRAYKGIKAMLDRLAAYMETAEFSSGRDGNFRDLLSGAKNFADIRESFKRTYNDLAEEQKTNVRGNANLSYDEK